MESGWQVHEGADYVDQLIAALGHPELQTPRRAAWILGELATPRAVDPLLRVPATTDDPYLQATAAEALGKIGQARAVAGLAETLAHGFLPARVSAAEALGRIGGPPARSVWRVHCPTPVRSSAKLQPKRSLRLAPLLREGQPVETE